MPTIVSRQPSRSTGVHRIKDTKPQRTYLNYLDGLRGLAIGLVVIFHVFVGRVSSGVDVFLLIGGMLFLSSQMKNFGNPDGITFLQSLIRIIRRLAPSLIVVVASTTVFLMLTKNSLAWRTMFTDSAAAAGYWMNERLIYTESDYASAGNGVSPFQHLWSMSVQFQTYVFLLSIIALIFAVCRVFGKEETTSRKITIFTVAFLTALSFAVATWRTYFGIQSENYYETTSRMWEIGLGSLIGLFIFSTILAPYLRWILSIIGVLLIVTTGVWINGVEKFPGPAVLIPLVGAIMVVASGQVGKAETRSIKSVGIVIWLLESKPMTFLGKISYSLYLWHWVILIATMSLWSIDEVNAWQGSAIIAVSLVLALINYYAIEKPLRQKEKPDRGRVLSLRYISDARRFSSSPWSPVSATVMSVLAILVLCSPLAMQGAIGVINRDTQKAVDNAGGYEFAYPGAMTLVNGVDYPRDAPVYPNLLDEQSMLPQTQSDGCFSRFNDDRIILSNSLGNPCEYGDTSSERTMYLVGGSHSEQFLPALDTIGKKHRIKIIPLIKMGCALYQPVKWNMEDYPGCYDVWSPEVEEFISQNPPTDGIVMIGTRPSTMWGGGPEVTPDYYREAFSRIASSGVPIYSIRDNPWIVQESGPIDPRFCVYEGGRNQMCGMSWDSFYWGVAQDPSLEAFADIPNIKHLDFSNMYNNDGWVDVITGNILVYRDGHHLTRQYVESMTPEIERQMINNPWTPSTDLGHVSGMNLEVVGANQREYEDNYGVKRPEQVYVPGQSNPVITEENRP